MTIRDLTPPRCAAYQVMRYLDGAMLMFTSTRRGKLTLYRMGEPNLSTGRPARWERVRPEDVSYEIDRAVRSGYDVIAVGRKLQDRAMGRKLAA